MEYSLPESVYTNYVYAYPHKTAYRLLSKPIRLRTLWEREQRHALHLYMHIPFCEFRCGFCNLFTRAIPPEELPVRFLSQLRNEAESVREALGDSTFGQFAIGGGTPTYLNENQLEELFKIAQLMNVDAQHIPTGIECSPATISPSKLSVLLVHGVERISIGIQSLSESTCKTLGRPQDLQVAHRALEMLSNSNLARLNVDLIYGSYGQTPEDFLDSINALLPYNPVEIFLYPLYVRELTGLRKTSNGQAVQLWDQQRLELYRVGRARLLDAGYRQISMRMFSRLPPSNSVATSYCCQNDGMVGLGCGARSYTRGLHYSGEYAVGRQAVHAILNSYLERDPDEFGFAYYGFQLSEEEQQRRFLLISLLQAVGMSVTDFQHRFGQDPRALFCELDFLTSLGLLEESGGNCKLTEQGLERSDQIGPWLFSEEVTKCMESYECL